MGLTRNTASDKDSVIFGQYSNGPSINLYEGTYNPTNGTFHTRDLKISYGCCYGVLQNVRLAVSIDGTIWGTMTRFSDGKQYVLRDIV
jgi:hypothetical protein